MALAATLAAVLPAVAGQAKAATVNYVALGDSYSTGVGTGSESGSCDQSSQAYGPLWASDNGATFTFGACSGATTSSVISSQLSYLSSSTTLVSLTIGGNDVGFSSIMETCVLESTSSCESAVDSAETYANDTLPGDLDTMFADIHKDAPNATIVLLDYPDFYDTSVSICIGLSGADHTALNAGINDLDGVLQRAAARDGATFADVRSEFSGHELCDGSADWLHSVDLTDIDESYHPTADGQADGYLPIFTSAAESVGQ
ncbi:MAG TPA: SGNH/GDSL hydrolase family protein [Trebonia sp.]|jgi:lysophospholipase L1-like esterase